MTLVGWNLVTGNTRLAAADQLADLKRPNIVILLADDLGFSDLGCYGGEIQTPNLNQLAESGLRFTQFYNTARCWPTRGSLLTGYYAQQIRRDTVPDVKSGNGGTRPAWAKLLPELLKPLGYRNYHSGKWHVDGQPLANGFDHSYRLDDHDRHLNPTSHSEDGRPLPKVEPGSGHCSSQAIADHMLSYLREHASQHADQPYLAFVAFTAPHFPLQAPADDIARYSGKYDIGWDAVRSARAERLRDSNIFSGIVSDVEREQGPPYHYPEVLTKIGPGEVNRPIPWNDLTDAQRQLQSAKMSIHAAMVDRMDREIGRLLEQIRAMPGAENTLVLFLSDNGASAEMMVRGDGHDLTAPPGSPSTFLCLGPGWSTVANTPFRKHKTWVHEGGIATPLIVSWPAGIRDRGQLRRTPGHVIDIVPTLLELTQADTTSSVESATAPSRPGRSLLAAWHQDVAVERPALWWLHEGNRALRVGDWKIVAAGDRAPWELYDLSQDRAETRNLADHDPARVREMESLWSRMRDEFFQQARQP
ncbi:MAG: arylsulfatase [Pirellulales bacterium]